jgi:hypothetical protein
MLLNDSLSYESVDGVFGIFQFLDSVILFLFFVVGDNPAVLDSVKQDVYSLSTRVHQFAFDIVFAPLKLQLADIPVCQ